MPTRSKAGKPGERARDEARTNDDGPKFAAGEWELADERDPDERLGKSRSDGGAPAEQYVRAEGDDDAPDVIEDVEDDDHDPRDEVDPEAQEAAAEYEGTLESSANPAGVGRGEKPKPHTKTSAKKSGAKRRR